METALKLRDALAKRRRETSLEVFEDLESLHQWARTDSHPFAAIVCVGGDGTQSTTALAAMRRSVPFLPVSSGFGNLFARAFNHPSTMEGTLDLWRVVRSSTRTSACATASCFSVRRATA